MSGRTACVAQRRAKSPPLELLGLESAGVAAGMKACRGGWSYGGYTNASRGYEELCGAFLRAVLAALAYVASWNGRRESKDYGCGNVCNNGEVATPPRAGAGQACATHKLSMGAERRSRISSLIENVNSACSAVGNLSRPSRQRRWELFATCKPRAFCTRPTYRRAPLES